MRLTFMGFFLVAVQLSGQSTGELIQHFAGCYKLVALSPLGRSFDFPPRFELTTQSLNPSANWFAVRSFKSGTEVKWPFSDWTLRGDGKLEISWGSGFVGYGATLSEAKGRLVGSIRHWSDDRNWALSADVEFQRISCKLASSKSR